MSYYLKDQTDKMSVCPSTNVLKLHTKRTKKKEKKREEERGKESKTGA